MVYGRLPVIPVPNSANQKPETAVRSAALGLYGSRLRPPQINVTPAVVAVFFLATQNSPAPNHNNHIYQPGTIRSWGLGAK